MMQSNKVFHKTLKAWAPFAVMIVIFSFLVYAAVQQNYRTTSDDPQVQIAEDVAAAIQQGTPPDSIAPTTGTTDIRASLSPFILVYDSTGKQIGSSAILDGKNPTFPSSVFDQVKAHGEDRLTWQPENGVREAVVVTQYTGTASGYIVVGRNLRETEKRENMLLVMCALACLFGLILTFLVIWLFKRMSCSYCDHCEHCDMKGESGSGMANDMGHDHHDGMDHHEHHQHHDHHDEHHHDHTPEQSSSSSSDSSSSQTPNS